jgi:hypothetical protein
VERLAEVLVEVVDVLGGEEGDAGAAVPEWRRFGTREGFVVGKEVTRERKVVKRRVELQGVARRGGGFGRCLRK